MGAFVSMTMTTFQQQLISRIGVCPPHELAPLVTRWWGAIAAELIPVVGFDCFFALYGRTMSLTRGRFPWIGKQQSELTFDSLKRSLETRNANEALDASVALLVHFTDILDRLIGATLTSHLVGAAWRHDHVSTAATQNAVPRSGSHLDRRSGSILDRRQHK